VRVVCELLVLCFFLLCNVERWLRHAFKGTMPPGVRCDVPLHTLLHFVILDHWIRLVPAFVAETAEDSCQFGAVMRPEPETPIDPTAV
jgi:hypothetical protein